MGADIQKECEDCCTFDPNLETEVKKDHTHLLKSVPNSNGGDIMNESTTKNNLTFIDNNVQNAILIITNPKIYQKMLKGERLHLILEPLTSFLNKNLFEIVSQLLIKITELQKSSYIKNNVYILFEKTYKDLINNKIIDNLSKADLGYFTKIKFHLLYVIEILAELYHYFNYHLSDGKEPYNVHYWEFIKNSVSYMKDKIHDFQKCIEDINNFIVENKIKNLSHSVDIHIITSNFNIQMEQ